MGATLAGFEADFVPGLSRERILGEDSGWGKNIQVIRPVFR